MLRTEPDIDGHLLRTDLYPTPLNAHTAPHAKASSTHSLAVPRFIASSAKRVLRMQTFLGCVPRGRRLQVWPRFVPVGALLVCVRDPKNAALRPAFARICKPIGNRLPLAFAGRTER